MFDCLPTDLPLLPNERAQSSMISMIWTGMLSYDAYSTSRSLSPWALSHSKQRDYIIAQLKNQAVFHTLTPTITLQGDPGLCGRMSYLFYIKLPELMAGASGCGGLK